MAKLTKEQIESIPALILQGNTLGQVAHLYQVHERTINRWIRIMRGQGIVIDIPKGRRALTFNTNGN